MCLRKRHCQYTLVCSCMLHAKTRSRELVQDLFKLGLSISYDRVLSISTNIGNSVCHQYEQDGVICPANICKGLFTTAAVDNINHNPSLTTAHEYFMVQVFRCFNHFLRNIPVLIERDTVVRQRFPTDKTTECPNLI